MKKINIRFPRGVKTVHIPFLAEFGAYRQIYEQIKRIEYPKTARRIEGQLLVSIDLKDGSTSFELGQVSVIK